MMAMISPLSMTRHLLAGLAVATLLMTCMSSCVLSAGFSPAMSAIHAHNAASHLGQAPTTYKAELLSCSGAMLRLRVFVYCIRVLVYVVASWWWHVRVACMHTRACTYNFLDGRMEKAFII